MPTLCLPFSYLLQTLRHMRKHLVHTRGSVDGDPTSARGPGLPPNLHFQDNITKVTAVSSDLLHLEQLLPGRFFEKTDFKSHRSMRDQQESIIAK